MKLHQTIFIACICILTTSCVRFKEESAPWSLEALPVVYGLLTPDSVAKILFTTTYTGKHAETYPHAKAIIIEENGIETELFRQDSLFMDLKHGVKVEKGKTYRLLMKLDNELTLHAETKVPNETAVFSEFSFIPIDTMNNSQLSAYFKSKWTVPAANISTNEYYIYTSWQWDVNAVKTSAVEYSAVASQLIYPADSGEYTISLFTTDVWLSRFLMNRHYQVNALSDGADITHVIASEFSGVLPNFSNIENGLGVFGSYLIHTRNLEGNIVKESK